MPVLVLGGALLHDPAAASSCRLDLGPPVVVVEQLVRYAHVSRPPASVSAATRSVPPSVHRSALPLLSGADDSLLGLWAARRNGRFGFLSTKELRSRAAAALAAPPSSSTPLPAGKRNPPLEALEALLAEARATTSSAQNVREVTQAKHIWRAYLRVQEHADITPETWRAILEGVVPAAAAAAEYKPKPWRKRAMTEYFEQGFDERLERVLRDKTSVGQPPTEDDYLFVLHQFSTAGSIKRVEENFETMVGRGIAPSQRAYTLRLRAIRVWLRRYTSRQAQDLIAKGALLSWGDAVTHLPDLVASIMVQVQEGAFASVIPDDLVDEACLIYARLGDWDKFNSLVRWGYGVDLDVPDAIPQEYLDRVQDDDVSLSRGMRKAGLDALLTLCLAAGQPWRALSSLEIFAYDTATPEHLHPALSRRRPADVAEAEDDDRFLRYAPPLPPSSAIAMMNLRPVPVSPPGDYTPDSAAASSSSAAAEGSASGVPPPAGVMYEVPEPSLRFQRPSIELDSTTFAILLRGIREQDTSVGPVASLVALYRHVLTRALAAAYDERQRLSGALLHALSHPADAADARLRDLQTLDYARLRARPRWFGAIVELVELEPDARARFDVLGWAEDELRHWRLASEMDLWIVEKTIDVLTADRLAAVAKMTTPAGASPASPPLPSTASRKC